MRFAPNAFPALASSLVTGPRSKNGRLTSDSVPSGVFSRRLPLDRCPSTEAWLQFNIRAVPNTYLANFELNGQVQHEVIRQLSSKS